MGFNSLQVRLVDSAIFKGISNGSWFQFLTGAISRIKKGRALVTSIGFNSLQVRLVGGAGRAPVVGRLFQFLTGAISSLIGSNQLGESDVSIPYRCD